MLVRFLVASSRPPPMSAAPSPTASMSAIAAESAGRRRSDRRGRASGNALTRFRRRSGARGAVSRNSSRTMSKLASDIAHHPLLELLERPAQSRGDSCRPDPEHARRRLAVELQHHPQHHDLALGSGKTPYGCFDGGREPLSEHRLSRLGHVGGSRCLPVAVDAARLESGRERCSARAGTATFAPMRGSRRSGASAGARARRSPRRGLRRGVGFRSCRAGSGRRRRGAPRPRSRSSAARGRLAYGLAMRWAPRSRSLCTPQLLDTSHRSTAQRGRLLRTTADGRARVS